MSSTHGQNGNEGTETLHTTRVLADKIEMQHRLFGALSAMFANEVPMYDRSLAVNRACNRAVCVLLGRLHPGFAISDEELERTSGERHGAIRIGRNDEYRWVTRYFAQFGMEPHNYYDMSSVGAKSQPFAATAFRSRVNPDHRVFTSLLKTDYFDSSMQMRIEQSLSERQVFSDGAKRLIEKAERQGGLTWEDATALIREGTERIFKWTGKARDYPLYTQLCEDGFKIAADIACFERHHLNHLTPNTLCMDLYTAAMKFCLAEIDEAHFRMRAKRALERLLKIGDKDWMRLHFKNMDRSRIDALCDAPATSEDVRGLVDSLVKQFGQSEFNLSALKHNGFKDFTEGPSEDTPVLLRQDAYKALTEAVTFTNPDGTTLEAVHTARFGEIEQRFYATTPKGRELYDTCLAIADAAREKDPSLPKRDFAQYEALYAEPFAAFPKTLRELLAAGLIRAKYSPTSKGIAARGTILTTDIGELERLGYVQVEGLRYEDFLPVSAAGIFASNSNQYGTQSTAKHKPVYTQAMHEQIMGRAIIDSDAQYRAIEAESLLKTIDALGLSASLPEGVRAEWKRAAEGV